VFRSILEKYERLVVYLPLVGTAFILIIQDFFQGFLSSISLNIAVAGMAIAIILLVWHLETRIAKLTDSVDHLATQVNHMAKQQPLLLREASSNFQITSLGDAFRAASSVTPKVQHLRIYSITSAQMVSFLQHSGILVDRCSLLISKSTRGRPLMESQIEAAIQGWRALVENGSIALIEIRRYDFFPTEYEAIFDATFLILGLFHPSANETSGARVRDPMTIHAQSSSGAKIVSEFTDRFDRLFESCHGDEIIITRSAAQLGKKRALE
jgi:hypothetical protein